MPNWAYNSLTVEGDAEKLAAFRQEQQRRRKDDAAADYEVCDLTFSASLPIPAALANTTAPAAEDALLQARYGSSDWFHWCVANWGTKWDATNVDVNGGTGDSNELFYSFDTAWAPPLAWLNRVATLYPELDFQLTYEQECDDLGGVLTYERGRFVDEEEYTMSEKRWEDMHDSERADVLRHLGEVLVPLCPSLADPALAVRTDGVLLLLGEADEDDDELFTEARAALDDESLEDYLRGHELTLDFLRTHLAVEVARTQHAASRAEGGASAGADEDVAVRSLSELDASLAATECSVCMTGLGGAHADDAGVGAAGAPLCSFPPLSNCLAAMLQPPPLTPGETATSQSPAAATALAASRSPTSLRAKAGLPPPEAAAPKPAPQGSGASVHQLCCGHAFHGECITRWRATAARGGVRKGCPLCRRPILLVTRFEP